MKNYTEFIVESVNPIVGFYKMESDDLLKLQQELKLLGLKTTEDDNFLVI